MILSDFYILRLNNSNLVISPRFGCNTTQLVLDGKQILVGNKKIGDIKKDTLSRGDFLAPFPNRICDGKYSFEGKKYQLFANETARNHALHGFLMKKPFELIKKNNGHANASAEFKTTITSGEFEGYPFDLEISIRFILSNTELKIKMTGMNRGSQNIPYGIGWHPYLSTGKKIDDCMIQIPARSVMETSQIKELIPTGKYLRSEFGTKLKKLGRTQFDTCFADVTDRVVRFEQIELFMDETMEYLQIYTPEDRSSIAIEPMSCAPDAFNNGLGLITLAPKEEISHTFGVRLVQ